MMLHAEKKNKPKKRDRKCFSGIEFNTKDFNSRSIQRSNRMGPVEKLQIDYSKNLSFEQGGKKVDYVSRRGK